MKQKYNLSKKIENQLSNLKLKVLIPLYKEVISRSSKKKLSYEEFLSLLLDDCIRARDERSYNARINKAHFPFLKTFEQFDFIFQPSLNEKEIVKLGSLGFLEDKENVIFLGPPGVGKTHLSVALGIKGCMAKYRVIFKDAKELIKELMLASRDGSFVDKLLFYSRIDLLVIDEVGYMPINNEEANLFFQLVSIRYEKGSIILTSNYAFDDWNNIFDNDMVAAAIIDRLVHHSHIYLINGESYRIKNKIRRNKN